MLQVRLHNVSSGHLLATLEGMSGAVTTLAFTPDGNLLSCASGGTVRMFEVKRAIADKHMVCLDPYP